MYYKTITCMPKSCPFENWNVDYYNLVQNPWCDDDLTEAKCLEGS